MGRCLGLDFLCCGIVDSFQKGKYSIQYLIVKKNKVLIGIGGKISVAGNTNEHPTNKNYVTSLLNISMQLLLTFINYCLFMFALFLKR